jgi:hypothetical protein
MRALVATRFNPDFKAKPEREVEAGRAVEPWPGKRDRLRCALRLPPARLYHFEFSLDKTER